ncbi:MAG: lysylphosphatidylglycerol synthase transmembrane domain-containing protein, partial [Planctomycetia bacterium]
MLADETAPEPWPDGSGQTADRRRLPGWLSILLRLAATAALMAFALRSVEWHKLVGLFSQIDWRWWVAGLVTGALVQVVGAIRWAALARPIGFPYSLGVFVWRFFEGMFFSLCLPTTIGGDVVKAYRLADSTHGRLLAGCTVLADRLTGLTALGVLAGAAAIGKEASLGTATTFAVGGGLLTAAIAVIWLGVGSLDRLLSLFPEPHAARQFISRLLPYQLRPSLMVQALGWSLIVQAGGSIAVAFMARGIGVNLPLSIWFAVVPLIALAMVLPIS